MNSITFIKRGEDAYPARLLHLEMAPEHLWARGHWDGHRPAVAIVGTRAASQQGLGAAFSLACDLAGAGVPVISGGALGIDAAAHSGALHGAGPTCVVLGTGVDVIYPQRHAALFAQVVQERGCLLSSFPLGTPPKPWHFPARNRLIAALAEVIVVIEAQPGSGSRYTALFGRRLGRPVLCLPGSPGTAELLAEGVGQALRGAADVLRCLPGDTARDVPLGPLFAAADPAWAPPAVESTDEVRAVLDAVPRDLGEISRRAGLSPATCAAAVVDLELRGLCLRVAGGRYMGVGGPAHRDPRSPAA